MFDDQPISSTPPANLPTEADDMFATVDKMPAGPVAPSAPNAIQAGVLKPKNNDAVMPTPTNSTGSIEAMPTMYAVKEPIVGKVILLLVLLAVLGGAGYFGYRLYASGFFSATPTSPLPTPAVEEGPIAPPIIEPVAPEPVAPVVAPEPLPTTTAQAGVNMASDEILFGQGVDSDKDGLDDVREAEIGTNPTQTDSDSDELSDGDEVIIWKTDPLKKDTDGDTFSDGQEVKNGYNPLGPGKLFNVPTTTAK
ncbi:MAG: hypothetical protein A3J93_01420 [Candidatus Magasanikbacteria bacterium RIFOXYC2_FULL_42_28]|uniref:Uncharacterized protein n=1 Tax=Candidatus Magasanikbacteria bacterium RIFOXYC2_FULL_42_28 TaxID=1798704 RepID=A0A1F6NXY3_9BACT|nr:MAG: hypothetical protein A3J93_01420 [Candidatus Magasanikbacteria bacterium RIFOXYC2_FULL_42_28]